VARDMKPFMDPLAP